LVDADLATMHAWLNEPGVVRWWEGSDVSMDAVVADYGSQRTDLEVEHWIASVDDKPFGWICCWPVTEDLEEAGPWFPLGVAQTAAGIDYLVGDTDRRGQGLGSAMIRAFVFNVVFGRHCEWTQVAASPYEGNVGSWKALEKAGFTFAGMVQYPDDDEGPCHLMMMDRPDNGWRVTAGR